MAERFHLEKCDTIGKWTAELKTGRKLILVVHGVIPCSGKKEPSSLKLAQSQSADPSVLVLQLSPDVAVFEGADEIHVYYSEVIDRYDRYESILVRGSGRTLAFLDVVKMG